MDTKLVQDLSDYIKLNAKVPFEWGVFDCCIFSLKCVEIQTGLDLYKDYRGKYKTELGAKRAVKKFGTVESKLDKHFERVDPRLARRGDIIMHESGNFGVCFGGGVYSTSDLGVTRANHNEKPYLCWRVG